MSKPKLLNLLAVTIASISFFETATSYGHPTVIIENEGMRIADVGEVQEKFRDELRALTPDQAVPRVGFVYDYHGLFYVDFWTSRGRYCLYSGERFAPVEDGIAAEMLGISQDDLSKPLLYRFPWGLSILVGFFLCVSAYRFLDNRSYKKEEKRLESLVNDPTYRQTILKFERQHREAVRAEEQPGEIEDLSQIDVVAVFTPTVFHAAVNDLVEQGVERTAASDNLRFMLNKLEIQRILAEL